ncbi:hypothetical protein [Streptomyces sp. NBC_01264]|uniref:hypothetical protein n=1 Tax=Streptomyces sp. NBC_01264 TaxID=2903804 RepID=UPI002257689F|nr:hypothetical protein [Streptomyces sp. NBC_01264]MCX4776095.1 hypothetical protein [Streptomyces sp. NBC_01264]
MFTRPALALAAAVALALTAATVPASASPSGTDIGKAEAERAIVYRATAPFQRHAAAVKAGYVPDKHCVEDRAGSGALGFPHFNHAYDNSVDPAKPAALFYEDDGRGGKRLVGAQWLVYDRDQDTATDDDRPKLFGRSFDGPTPGRFPRQPVHYALHLWLWKKNPLGTFATYSPAVACLPGTTRPKRPTARPADPGGGRVSETAPGG